MQVELEGDSEGQGVGLGVHSNLEGRLQEREVLVSVSGEWRAVDQVVVDSFDIMLVAEGAGEIESINFHEEVTGLNHEPLSDEVVDDLLSDFVSVLFEA